MILNASYNQISDMFEHVELPNLRMLNLAFNALEDLPDKMGEVPNLELLYVSNNKLEVTGTGVRVSPPSRVREPCRQPRRIPDAAWLALVDRRESSGSVSLRIQLSPQRRLIPQRLP
jgi:hypothetical protein